MFFGFVLGIAAASFFNRLLSVAEIPIEKDIAESPPFTR